MAFPGKKPQKSLPEKQSYFLILSHQGKVWLEQRESKGLYDMLYAEIYDQFVRATAEEKEAGIKLDKNQTLLDRLQTDARFAAVARDYTLPEDIRSFLQERTLTDACALQKVFIGKIIAIDL